MGRWSSKGAGGEVVTKGTWWECNHQKGADGEVVIRRELVGKWS